MFQIPTPTVPSPNPISPHSIQPQVFEPGVYGQPRGPEAQIDSPAMGPSPETTVRAIGMAALPAEFKAEGQQLHDLTYQGMTSKDYAARHAAWLQTQLDRRPGRDDDDEDEKDGTRGKKVKR